MFYNVSDFRRGQSKPPSQLAGVNLDGVLAQLGLPENEVYFKCILRGMRTAPGMWRGTYELHFESPGAENLGEHGAASHESH